MHTYALKYTYACIDRLIPMRVYAVEYTYVYLSPNTDVRVHVMTYVAYLHDQQDPEHTGGGKGVPVTHPASLPVKTVCVDLL